MILGWQEEANNVCCRRPATFGITEVIRCMTQTGPQKAAGSLPWIVPLPHTPAATLQSEGFATRVTYDGSAVIRPEEFLDYDRHTPK
jgi:hypothetical protein